MRIALHCIALRTSPAIRRPRKRQSFTLGCNCAVTESVSKSFTPGSATAAAEISLILAQSCEGGRPGGLLPSPGKISAYVKFSSFVFFSNYFLTNCLQVSSLQGPTCKYCRNGRYWRRASPRWEAPTRWFPGFEVDEDGKSWDCCLLELIRARSSQRRTNKSECEFLFWTTNQLIYSEDPLQRWFPGFEVEEAFFGKAWMWKLREGCLLELIRARSLQSSAMNTWEWMQRSNKFGLSTDWVRRDAVCGNKKGFMWRKRTSGKRLQLFLDFWVPYIHMEWSRFHKKRDATTRA